MFSSIRIGIVVLSVEINRIEFIKSPRFPIVLTRTYNLYKVEDLIFRANNEVNASSLFVSSTHLMPAFPGLGINLSSPSTAMATIFAHRNECLCASVLAIFMLSIPADFIAFSSMAISTDSDVMRSRVARVISSILNVRVTSLGLYRLIRPKNFFFTSNSVSFSSNDTPLLKLSHSGGFGFLY